MWDLPGPGIKPAMAGGLLTDGSLKSEIFMIENAVESGKGKYVDDAI